MTGGLGVEVRVAAPVQEVWDYVLDWRRQGEWIPATTVRVDGPRVVARTAVGPFGFDDVMYLTTWDPPNRCEIAHVGRVVRGTGVISCRADAGGTLLRWSEQVAVPGGLLAPLLWGALRRPLELGFRHALRRACDRIEQGTGG